MRQILIDNARRKQSVKHGSQLERVELGFAICDSPRMGQQHHSLGQSAATERREAPP